MTEEEMANVHGKEITENGDDHGKIKAEYCNGVARKNDEGVNGNVGDDVSGGTEAVADSGESDLVAAVESNGVASAEQKVEGESIVTVTNNKENDSNGDCAMLNGSAEETPETTSVDDVVVRESDSVCEDRQNVSGSVVLSGINDDTVDDGGHELKSVENGVSCKEQSEGVVENENEIRDEVVNAIVKEKGVTVDNHEVDASDVQNGIVKENEIRGDGVADVDTSDREFEGGVVQNGALNDVEEIEVPEEEVVEGEEVTAAATATTTDLVDSDKDSKILQSENVATEEDVSDENHIVTNGIHHVVGEDNDEKNEIPVDVVNGVSTTTDLKECDGEDAENGLEKAHVESVSDIDASVQNGSAEVELSECAEEEKKIPVEGSELKSSEERSGNELIHEGENVIENGDVVSDMNGDAVESEGELCTDVSGVENKSVENGVESSTNAVDSAAELSANAAELSTNAVDSEAELSNNAVQSEAESSTSAVDSAAELSTNAVDGEAKLSNNAVQSEAESSTNAVDSAAKSSNNSVQSEAGSSKDVVQGEAETSADISDVKINAVESEAEPSSVEGSNADEDSRNTQELSTTDTINGESMGAEVLKKPSFFWLIRHPRYDDGENIKEQIKVAQNLVDEKTKSRDAVRTEFQAKKAECKEYSQHVRAAVSAERAARDLLKSKRQEMDSVQSRVNRLNNAISVGDITDKIKNIEHMLEHETLPLKEEKQLIREIKQLKQNRDELSTIMGKQDQSLDHKDSVEDHFKQLQLMKNEVELLRNNVLKAEAETKAARKKYDEQCNEMSEFHARFQAADDIRQEAYAKLQALRKQLHEKSKYFWEYKNASYKGQELAAAGNREELEGFCMDQVERTMEMWNKNDEFRMNYVRCNIRSTLRRLQTPDGRSLGPDEEPPVIPNAFTERASKNDSLATQSILEQERKPIATESFNTKDEPVSKVVVHKTEKTQTTKAKKPAKPAPLEKSVAVFRWGDESDEDIKEPVRTKEEEEQILKAEKARKEEEAAKLKEMLRQEEIEKAKEAQLRKKRNAEKAQQRAALKAQKEAEQKEKEREKKARKKERRKAGCTDAVVDNTEQEASPSSETLARPVEECEQSEKPVEAVVTKRTQKPSQFTKQTKVKSLPMSLRNRGKRRIQPWMWVLIAVLVVVALFYMGNSNTLRSSLQGFGF